MMIGVHRAHIRAPYKENFMTVMRILLSAGVCAMTCMPTAPLAHAQQARAGGPVKMYNTAKKKLMDGKPLVGITISSPDPNIYCAAANSGFDYTWIEMQHSPLTYSDVAKMIWACRGASAMPLSAFRTRQKARSRKRRTSERWASSFPRSTQWRRRRTAVKWSKYPPEGRRSQGGGQYGALNEVIYIT